MKIFTATIAALSASVVNAVQQNADIYYHKKEPLGPSMWHFSSDGLTIFSPDGSQKLKEHPKKSICKPYKSWRGGVSEDCYFFTQASDGHKYVWATSLAGQHRVEAFDIDSGDYVAYMPTCSTPIDMEYHPGRHEMWVRCAQATGDQPGEIDVFSSSSLSADFQHIYLNETGRPYGRISIHSSMGTYGYASAYDQNDIIELDLSSKTVNNRFEVPEAQGFYDITYSPFNRHLFVRARVCCGCGFEGASLPECGRARKVDILTGPNAGMMQVNGTCGAGCEGSLADSIGVVEFDTVNGAVVANHNIKEGTGFGADPVASPDGKYVLLLPNDGGAYVRVIMPGTNGEASTVMHDVPTNFKGGTPGKTVVSDYAFVQDGDKNILVLGASSDNDVVIVDLNDSPNFRMRKLTLSTSEESTGGSSRKLEWAVGTNFVWVDGGELKQQYVLEVPDADIDNVKLERTLNGVTSGNMIFVNNYERERVAGMIAKMMPKPVAISDVTSGSETTVEESASASEASSDQQVTTNMVMDTPPQDEDKDGSDPIGIVALVVACVSLLLGIALAGVQYTAAGAKKDGADTQSLGSKNIA